MLITLAQGLALLLACTAVLSQCSRLRAAKKRDNEPAVEPIPLDSSLDSRVAPAPPITTSSSSDKPQDHSEPSSRICRHSTLSNGIRVATEAFRVEKGDRAMINVIVGVGSRHETEEINGIAHFTEHMIIGGSNEEIQLKAIELTYFDHRLKARTQHDKTEFAASCEKAADIEQPMQLLATMLVNADFQDVNVDRERPIIQSQMREHAMNKHVFLGHCFRKVAFHPNSLGLSIGGQKHTNASITASDIRRFYDAHYRSNNTIITAVGEVDHDEIVRLAEFHFKDYPKGDSVEAPLATWTHDYRVCITPQSAQFCGQITVQGPSGFDFVASDEGLIIQLFYHALYINDLPPYKGQYKNVERNMTQLPYKEFSTVGQCFFSRKGLREIILKWRVLAHCMDEWILEAAKEEFKRDTEWKMKYIEDVSDMLSMHMFHAGRPLTLDELWPRVQAITVDRFKSIAKRILLDGEFTLVGYAPRREEILSSEEISVLLRSPWELTREWMEWYFRGPSALKEKQPNPIK